MSERRDDERPPEREASLWWLTAAPLLWAAHFLACYVTAAIWCAKVVEAGGELGAVRVAIAVYTLVGLAGILAVGWHGLRMHRLGASAPPHDFDTPGDRHGFLGFSMILLSGLSAVATVFVALSAIFIEGCG